MGLVIFFPSFSLSILPNPNFPSFYHSIIEDHYSAKRNTYMPMDMEWAKDGFTEELFIVQARPETVHSQKDKTKIVTYKLGEEKKKLESICQGAAIGSQIGSGKASIIKDLSLMDCFKEGEILVTEMTDPDWEPILKQASGVVTNRYQSFNPFFF